MRLIKVVCDVDGRTRERVLRAGVYATRLPFMVQVYLVKKPVNFGPHFLVNESETR